MSSNRLVARSGLILAILVLATAFLSSLPATAAVSCSYFSPAQFVDITMDGQGDVAVIERDGDAIEMNGAPCGAATRFNTMDVYFSEEANPPVNVTAVISLRGGAFVPGSGAEAGTSDEIEFSANLDFYTPPSSGDRMEVWGGGGKEWIRMGNSSDFGAPIHVINLNANEPETVDWDVSDVGGGTWDLVRALGGAGRDQLSGAGGAATGARFDVRLLLIGGAAADSLTGGTKGDLLKGGSGNDIIRGGPGPDVLRGGPGNDTCRGGPGADTLVSC
jgi:Ca2+-binding RTX toxin-like protein